MKLSCALTTSLDTPQHVRIAESLGYERAWVYDSPALYADVWMMLIQAAERSSSIGIGPAVLVPSLRHPMVNAAAIATLAAAAPNRVAVAIGAGFTGRLTLGQRPMRWVDVEQYVTTLRALLRGETAQWEGATIAMMHSPGFGAARPVEVPILLGADGPVGTAVAARVGDGIIAAGVPNASAPAGSPHVLLQFGTVIDDGEDIRGRRVLDAAGHSIAVLYHALYERGGAAALRDWPGGTEWATAIDALASSERHLTTHEGHLVRLTPHDETAVLHAAELIPAMGLSGTPAALREKMAGYAAAGVTEIAYQPAGPDIAGELERMSAALL